MKVLVTGGAGYIGSHTCVELLENGYDVVVVDNLSNSKEESLNRIKKITGKNLTFYKCDILDKAGLQKVFNEHKIDIVIHFAGLKAVGESCKIPLNYYQNNITGTLVLLEVMKEYNCKNIIFSSSATVYGEQEVMPIKESAILQEPTNPYGKTKLFIEYILKDLYSSDKEWNVTLLRYFNPIGAHSTGLIGEDPNGIPNNLVPYITQVAIGKLKYLNVFGNDYPTHDGTGVRDYIHVCDLARGHVCAIKSNEGLKIYNLGTGVGYSVFDVLKAFNKVVGFEIPYKVCERRSGDIAVCFADPEKAYLEMNFKTEKTLEDMARDSWNWQSKNPNGLE